MGARLRDARGRFVSSARPSNVTSLPQLQAQWLLQAGRAAGVTTELQALRSSALFRGVSLVAGTLAGLPFNSYTGGEGADRKRVPSVFDNPDPDGQTPFEWKETAFTHLMLYGRCGALKVKTEAGGLAALPLVHPNSFTVALPTGKQAPAGGVWFDITLDSGKAYRTDAEGFWYVPALSLDGRTGVGLLELAAESIGTALAGDDTASALFTTGATISGLATPDDDGLDITEDIPAIRQQLTNATSGEGNAGKIALVNRRLKFTPWTMTAQQAQVLESRQFQIEEISRWTGVPPHLLMQTDKQTSWGTGVDEQNRGLSKFVLGHWASRFEQRASRLLSNPRWTEFDFAGLERPNFAVEIELLLKQTGGKPILTVNEARAVRNLPPVEGGDVLMPAPAPAGPEPKAGPDAPTE